MPPVQTDGLSESFNFVINDDLKGSSSDPASVSITTLVRSSTRCNNYYRHNLLIHINRHVQVHL
jgi:hypothetical protein